MNHLADGLAGNFGRSGQRARRWRHHGRRPFLSPCPVLRLDVVLRLSGRVLDRTRANLLTAVAGQTFRAYYSGIEEAALTSHQEWAREKFLGKARECSRLLCQYQDGFGAVGDSLSL